MKLAAYDYATHSTWALVNHHFDVLARSSLESLRPSNAWISHVGMSRSGDFRSIAPTTFTTGMPLTLTLDAEVRWGPPFANSTHQYRRSWLLYSFRPADGSSGWVRSNRDPPNITYFLPGGSPPNPVRDNPAVANQVRDEEPSSSSTQVPAGPLPLTLMMYLIAATLRSSRPLTSSTKSMAPICFPVRLSVRYPSPIPARNVISRWGNHGCNSLGLHQSRLMTLIRMGSWSMTNR